MQIASVAIAANNEGQVIACNDSCISGNGVPAFIRDRVNQVLDLNTLITGGYSPLAFSG
jgi:hypothetical protein